MPRRVIFSASAILAAGALFVPYFAKSPAAAAQAAAASGQVSVWLSDPSSNVWLSRQPDIPLIPVQNYTYQPSSIVIDSQIRFQEMTGFGAALTDSSAWLIAHALTAAEQTSLLNQLFSRSAG